MSPLRRYMLCVSVVGLGVVAALGFALNDQGIVVPGVMLGVLAPVLVMLVVVEPVSRITDDPARCR